MWEVPFAAGLQILDADAFSHGVPRLYLRRSPKSDFDSLAAIESAFQKIDG
jgi:hypothetical protein